MRKKTALFVLGAIVAFCVSFVLVTDLVVLRFRSSIVSIDDVDHAPVAIVLGAKVKADGEPSDILRDRLRTAIDLYRAGSVEKILVSGDDGQVEYDEVNAMRVYLLAADVDPDDIFLDHAGFDTYDSMSRASKVFGVTKVIVVTQAYHLPRALYLANAFGIQAQGVVADRQHYLGILRYEVRELLADTKAVIDVVFHVSPHFLGDMIDSTGDGRVTWDEE
ncbi:MAG: ElyC/SanA/YdcF family protein [Patescibacteria group bacterium]